ncbi:sugar transferase [Parasediminibacterium sp. JCM 36343]|uniref:sugar transferase n=1 Tax=Parasediminibacterium sp. JCM 36343 TaxID=3374279 RepID=UPI00397B11BE
MLKRCVDVVVALVAIVILSPLFLLVLIITALSSGGAILYSQERIGYKGKPFMMYKFVSMYPDAEKNGPALWVKGDKRQTKWGVFMRKRRFDELPQLWNILKGDMSFVGSTRPERKYYIDQLVKIAPEYTNLLSIKPGLVSIGIVEYGYASSVAEMKERMQYDLAYLKNPSPFKDLRIIAKGMWKVLMGKGK